MSIPATELKLNLKKYLLLAATEDIYATRNGNVAAKLTAPYKDDLGTVDALYGSIPAEMTLEDAGRSAGRKARQNMKVLLDTCVVIDFLQKREPFASAAYTIFRAAAARQFDGFISTKSAYYLTYHFMDSDAQRRKQLSSFLQFIGMIGYTPDDVWLALASEIPDFEDAVMVEAAARVKMDCIVTRNERDYVKSPVPVYSPRQFVEKLEQL